MSIDSTTRRITYTGNGTLDTYSITFFFRLAADIKVTLVSATDDSVTSLAITTDFTVDVDASELTLVDGDLASGDVLIIEREVDVLQETELRNQGPYYPETIEAALDDQAMISQQISDKAEKALRVGDSETTIGTLPTVDERASQFLAFDASGDPIAASELTGVDSSLITPFGLSLMDDVNAAAARTTLGFPGAFAAISPLTTKGDLITFHTAAAQRLAVGSDSEIIVADSSQTAGLRWAAADDSSSEISNLGLACSISGSALTIALKTKAGVNPSSTSPVRVGFRNATLTTGTYSRRSATGSLSLVVPAGATLGHASGRGQYIFVYLLDNAGTIELGVSSVPLDEGTVHSSTAIGTGSDSNRVLYSTAARTNIAIRLIGRLYSNQVVAGTYDADVSEISLWPFKIPKVIAVYGTAAGQAIASGAVPVIDYDLLSQDNYNCVTTGASWAFTAPLTRKYRVTAHNIWASAAWLAGEFQALNLFVAGVGGPVISRTPVHANVTTLLETKGSIIVALTAGVAMDIRAQHGNAGSRSLYNDANYNFISISEED